MSPRHPASVPSPLRVTTILLLMLALVLPSLSSAAAADDGATDQPPATVEVDEPETVTPVPETTPEVTPEPDTSPVTTVEPEPTAVPTDPAEPTPAPPEPTAIVTATAPEPPATEVAVRPASTGRTIEIRATDMAGNLLVGACWTIFDDAGGGALGYERGTWCDNQSGPNDGVMRLGINEGQYVVRNATAPAGFGRASNRRVTIYTDRTTVLTVRFNPLSTLRIEVTGAATGDPVTGACFQVLNSEGWAVLLNGCDETDGASDGVVTIPGIDRGQYLLKDNVTPPGYVPFGNMPLSVGALNTTVVVPLEYVVSANLTIHKRSTGDTALPGSCFSLYQESTGRLFQSCDAQDGADDGEIHFTGMGTGSWLVRETQIPAGHFAVPLQTIDLTEGAAEELTLTDDRGGVLLVTTVDQFDAAVPGACFWAFQVSGAEVQSADVWRYACDGDDGANDGITRLHTLPAGDLTLRQDKAGAGHLTAADVPFTTALAQEQAIQVVNPLGGTIHVEIVDLQDNPATGGCFRVVPDGSTQTVGYACDKYGEPEDGVIEFTGLPAGDYVISTDQPPYLHGPATEQVVRGVQLAQTTNVTLVAPGYGTLIIHKQQPDTSPLGGACFEANEDLGGGVKGVSYAWACDEGTPGDIELRLPEGDFIIGETHVPDGFARADEVSVHITYEQTSHVTIVDPTTSTLTIRTVDLVSNELLKGACYYVADDAGGHPGNMTPWGGCDESDGNDGITTIINLQPGSYYLIQNQLVKNHPQADPFQFTIGLMEIKQVDLPVKGFVPKIVFGPWLDDVTTSSGVIVWKTDQLTRGTIEYGLTDELGQTTATGSEPLELSHRTELTGLPMNTLVFFKMTATNVNGTVESGIFVFRTLATDQNALLIVKKTDGAGVPLGGSCFAVFTDAGSGAQGNFVREACDAFDPSPNDGVLRIEGLRPGAYILMETLAPSGYKLAANKTFTVSAGQTKTITVKDPRGGATVTVRMRNEEGAYTPGACVDIYQRLSGDVFGNYVAGACDDFGTLDGRTIITGLRPGRYFAWESLVPAGHIRADAVAFTIYDDTTTKSVYMVNWQELADRNLVVRSVDSNGERVPGACFSLWTSPGSSKLDGYVDEACDSWDGRADGQVIFLNVTPGALQYVVMEHVAPDGYLAGKKTASFSLTGNTVKIINVVQIPGGADVTVTTLRGTTSTTVPGACYALEKLQDGVWYPVVFRCDSNDGASDGVTHLTGVKAGTYRLRMYGVPAGYVAPATSTVTIGTADKSVTVRITPTS